MGNELSPVRIALVTGYLGAGKTTLLNHMLSNDRGLRAAVIVNDIGEVNIDADLIASGSATESVVPLTNGCICCTLSDDLAEQLKGLVASGDYDYVVIEASGICEPMPIAYTISECCKASSEPKPDGESGQGALGRPLSRDPSRAVVDCARMIDEFEGGNRIAAGNYEQDDVEALIVEQLEFCTTVVLNKTDLVSPDELDEVKALVRSLQQEAVIVEAEHGAVPLDQLLDTKRFDFDAVYRSAAWLDTFARSGQEHGHSCGHDHDHDHGHEHDHSHEVLEYGISTFVYERHVPFNTEAFSGFAANWPREVVRTKGFAWLDQYPDTQFILEQAGAQRSFTDNGPFDVGERMTKLVFIGRNRDREAIEARLDACLVQ